MKIYISGKISGLPFPEVKFKFQEMQDFLEDLNFEVINPTKNGLTESHTWEQHIGRVLYMVGYLTTLPIRATKFLTHTLVAVQFALLHTTWDLKCLVLNLTPFITMPPNNGFYTTKRNWDCFNNKLKIKNR